MKGGDPETGFNYDDTKRYIEAAAVSAEAGDDEVAALDDRHERPVLD